MYNLIRVKVEKRKRGTDMWTTYWFEIVGEESEICGEEFFTELENGTRAEHKAYAQEIFPDERIRCLGKVTSYEAEMMGLDTY